MKVHLIKKQSIEDYVKKMLEVEHHLRYGYQLLN